MAENEGEKFPFITRKMLSFEFATVFHIRITSMATSSKIITIRGATREGQFTFSHTTSAFPTKKTENFQIPDVPIWISVVDSANNFVQGDLFTVVSLAINGEVAQQLASGYVYKEQGLTWPQTNISRATPSDGRLKTVTSATFGAGNEISLAPTNNLIYKVRAIHFKLTTSATAANRRVSVRITDVDAVLHNFISENVQTASLARDYSCFPTHPGGLTTMGSGLVIPITNDLLVAPSVPIETLTENIQAGDQFSVMTALVEQFIQF